MPPPTACPRPCASSLSRGWGEPGQALVGDGLARPVTRALQALTRFRAAATIVPVDAPMDEPELDEVWTLVQELPTAQRAVVVLRFYEDASLSEIATLLGRPASTVRSDLRRALTKLKESLV